MNTTLVEEQTFTVSDNIMLDPSILMDNEKLEKALSFAINNRDLKFFIPSRFTKLFDYPNVPHDDVEKFYGVHNVDWQRIKMMLREYDGAVTRFSITREHQQKHALFLEELYSSIKNETLTDILFEEWVFLQEYSWIVAKTQKTFNKFKDAGAWVLEGGKKAFDFAAKRMLRKTIDDILTRADKLRAIGKWIGVGISSATVFIAPMAAFGILAAYGYMMSIDPEE